MNTIKFPIMQKQMKSLFGKPVNNKEFKNKNLKFISLDEFENSILHIKGFEDYKNQSGFWGHYLIEVPIQNVFRDLIKESLIDQIYSFDGCFNIRTMKSNPNNFSVHSWGFAVDINANTNAYGDDDYEMSDEIVRVFAKYGFESGVLWDTPDGMHFQLCWIHDWNDDDVRSEYEDETLLPAKYI